MTALYLAILVFLLIVTLVWLRNYRQTRIAHQEFIQADCIDRRNDAKTRSIEKCRDAIAASLSGLHNGDVTECCRIHRTFSYAHEAFCKYRRNKSNSQQDVYLIYLWDAALKITELVRYFVSNPNYDISIANTLELNAIRNDLKDRDIKAEALKAKIADSLRNHTVAMTHADYNDSSAKYDLLVIYHHLYSFIISLEKLSDNKHYDSKDTHGSAVDAADAVMG